LSEALWIGCRCEAAFFSGLFAWPGSSPFRKPPDAGRTIFTRSDPL
jgi:hypothetical protein